MFSLKNLCIAAVIASANALSSSLQQVTVNFGSNPTNVQMYQYKPTKLATPTPLIIAMHYCGGTAQAYFTGTTLAQLADQHGFIVVYPNAPTSGGCWDVATTATLTHNGGGDSLGIANIVRYAIANWGVDASRVFATGTSSGAMMTNVLMGAYPDLFAAGSLYSGVPYGCFAGPSAWNSQCSQGQLIKTAQQWGDQVRSGYPGYTGTRPKVQFWHGTVYVILSLVPRVSILMTPNQRYHALPSEFLGRDQTMDERIWRLSNPNFQRHQRSPSWLLTRLLWF